jgi:glycosyltransferase involved in cell wall biosynthesis
MPGPTTKPGGVLFLTRFDQVDMLGKWWQYVDVARRVAGVESTFWNLRDGATEADMDVALASAQPAAVVVLTLAIHPAAIRRMAQQNPSRTWLITCHSNPAHLPLEGAILRWTEYLQLTQELPNVFMGMPDAKVVEAMRLAGHKVLYWPNVLQPMPDDQPAAKVPDPELPLVVGLFQQPRPMKNVAHQLLACAAYQRITGRPVRVLWTWCDGPPHVLAHCVDMHRMADMLQLDHVPVSHVERSRFLRHVLPRVDLCLQVSFTESWNYVAQEALAAGVRVVGSPAIVFLPPELQANPDNPIEVAETMIYALACEPPQLEHVVQLQNAAFVDLFRWLLLGAEEGTGGHVGQHLQPGG